MRDFGAANHVTIHARLTVYDEDGVVADKISWHRPVTLESLMSSSTVQDAVKEDLYYYHDHDSMMIFPGLWLGGPRITRDKHQEQIDEKVLPRMSQSTARSSCHTG